MTVAIGLVCSDGVLVASDSMGSDGHVAAVVKKVQTFPRSPAIWTASGSLYVMEEVSAELVNLDKSGTPAAPLAAFTTPVLEGVRGKVTQFVKKGMKAAYDGALGTPPGQFPQSFATDFLILGYANGTPWFLEIDPVGQVNWHNDAGFYSTGSGGEFAAVARGLMSHYLDDRPTLDIGKMIAYRTIETTVAVSSAMVGLPVQMAVCDDSGAHVLTDDELAEVGTGVARWKELERDTLRRTPAEAADEAKGDLPSIGAE